MSVIKIEEISRELRQSGISIGEKKIRLACFDSSQQVTDFTVPPNCKGFGRIHHFARFQGEGWPLDPLPIDPARHALGFPDADKISTQVFQNAICNLQCWYCFVDRSLVAGRQEHSKMVSVDEMLDCYLAEKRRPPMIDLTGGQPDLVPEWILWFADALHNRRLDKEIYLWSDDNLSTDFLWRFLDEQEIRRLASYRNYGRVGCFKGFDERSFSFNTGAPRELFGNQFSLMRRLVASGFDVYGYVTLTSDSDRNLALQMTEFVDRLQSEIHSIFPLRTIPQRILEFTPTKRRMGDKHKQALGIQDQAAHLWEKELERRFPEEVRNKKIYEHEIVI